MRKFTLVWARRWLINPIESMNKDVEDFTLALEDLSYHDELSFHTTLFLLILSLNQNILIILKFLN